MKPVKDILAEARKLIEKPENWCQGHYALSDDGADISWSDDSACRRCADGALMYVTRDQTEAEEDEGYWAALKAIEAAIGDKSGVKGITVFNDKHTHAEVLAAFDRAIEIAPIT